MLLKSAIILLIFLTFFYYILVGLQLLGALKITERDIKLGLALIPFYYLFAWNKKENAEAKESTSKNKENNG